MSLLQSVQGEIPLPPPERLEAAVARLCEAVLAENRLRREDVVAARFVAGEGAETAALLAAARRAGWSGVPLFRVRREADGRLEVEVHVRVRRKRRLRAVRVEDA